MRQIHAFVITTTEDSPLIGDDWPIEHAFTLADPDNHDMRIWLPDDAFLDWLTEHAPDTVIVVRVGEDAEYHRSEVWIADENQAFHYRNRWPEPVT